MSAPRGIAKPGSELFIPLACGILEMKRRFGQMVIPMLAKIDSAKPSHNKSWRELIEMPRVDLCDERQRIWGFFIPDDPAILETRSAEEWYRFARKLLSKQEEPTKSVVIPSVDETGKVNGKFYLCPWSETPVTPPNPLTRTEVAEISRIAHQHGKTLSFDEVMDALDEILEEDDDENGET